jgi:hypothetical protein
MNGKRIGFGEEIRVIYSIQQHEGAILLLCDRADVLEFTPTVFELQDVGVLYREKATVEEVLPLIGTEGGNIASIRPAKAASHPRGKPEYELTLEHWPKASHPFKTGGDWTNQTIKGMVYFRKYTEEERRQVFGVTQTTQAESGWRCDPKYSNFSKDGQPFDYISPHSAASKIIRELHKQGRPLTLATLCNKGANPSLRRRTFARHQRLFDALVNQTETAGKKVTGRIKVSLKVPLSVRAPAPLAASK